MRSRRFRSNQALILLPWFLIMVLPNLLSCSRVSNDRTLETSPIREPSSLEQRWGIQVLSTMLSAAGYMIDFRYRVTDPEKASFLANRRLTPYLIDQASGAKLFVPSPPKVGVLGQIGVDPVANRIHFILFANPGRFIKPGDKVTAVIGDFKAENCIVE